MSSSRILLLMVWLLLLALPALAEKPDDNRPDKNDNRIVQSSQRTITAEDEIGGRTLQEHIKDLSSADPSVRRHALMCIPYYGEAAGVAIPEVVKRLGDADASPRFGALFALEIMYIPKEQRENVIKGLGRSLTDPSSQQVHRFVAMKAMGRFGELKNKERVAVMDLVQNLTSNNFEVREAAIDALMVAGSDGDKGPDPRVIDALIFHANGFNERAEQVRFKAIMALGILGRPQDSKKLEQVYNVLKAPGNWNSSNKVIRMWSHVAVMVLQDKVYKQELEWIAKQLEDRSPHIRVQAATALGSLQDKAHAYVGNVCELIEREKDPMQLPTLIWALSRMKNKDQRVLRTLIAVTRLKEARDVESVLAACKALKELAPDAPEVRLALEKVVEHESLQQYQKDMVNKLIEELKSPPNKTATDPSKKPAKTGDAKSGSPRTEKPPANRVVQSPQPAITAESVIGGKTLSEHIKDLTNPDPSVRCHALQCIPFYGEAGGVAVPDVVKRLIDGDASPRVKAIVCLKMMYIPDTQRENVIKGLGRSLTDPNSQQVHRFEAMKALARFGALKDRERDAVMDLVQNLKSNNFEVREAAIDALLIAGPDRDKGPEPRVIDALINHANGFNEHAEQVRFKAIMALGALGRPQDPKKLDQVYTVLKARGNWYSSNKVIRMWSHVAVMALQDKVYEQELEWIAKQLEDRSSHIRVQAAMALGALQDKAHAYVGNVCELIERDKDPMQLPTIIWALSRMKNNGHRVLKTLIDVTERKDARDVDAVLAACKALKELAPTDPEVRQALVNVSKHESLQPHQKDMVNKLIEELKNPPNKTATDPVKQPVKRVGAKAGGAN